MSLKAASNEVETTLPVPHHTALKVYNISRSIAFYSLFGWEEEARFRAGPARAVWLKFPDQGCTNHRLELIEVPLALDPALKARDLSAASAIAVTGLNHFTLDVTAAARNFGGMRAYLRQLNARSETWFNKSIRLVVDPYQQIIAQDVYEMAFVSDPDGVLVELIAFNVTLPQKIKPAW
jgi:catechol 2,3-dioxygenase-like lactoylglutathione lyase family enzyme